MKKSTILLLVVVYILSFFVIGLLGHSIRNYNPTIYPESIELVKTDDKTMEYGKQGTYDYYFTHRPYTPGTAVRIKAIVKPDNTSSDYKRVEFFKDGDNNTFSLATHERNPDTIEENFVVITLTKTLAENEVLVTRFIARSTDPSNSIELKVGIAFKLS